MHSYTHPSQRLSITQTLKRKKREHAKVTYSISERRAVDTIQFRQDRNARVFISKENKVRAGSETVAEKVDN